MGFSCKGICIDFKGDAIPNGSKYNAGQKRCSFCGLFMNVQAIRCPCCSAILRTKSRNKKNV